MILVVQSLDVRSDLSNQLSSTIPGNDDLLPILRIRLTIPLVGEYPQYLENRIANILRRTTYCYTALICSFEYRQVVCNIDFHIEMILKILAMMN